MLKQVGRQLGKLIEENHVEVVDVIAANQVLLRLAFAENYQPFCGAIQSFDFDQVAELLIQSIRNLEN